jgi:hypothetical protein
VNTSSGSSVDVIVPCYRYGHFLRACVESVLAQSISRVRILIIDDASPDNAAEVATELAKGDSRVEFWRHNRNKGHIQTYNEGIEWTSGDYQLLLSADDYLLPGSLQRAADLLDAHPEAGFVFGRTFDVKGDVLDSESPANRAVQSVIQDEDSAILSAERFFRLIESFGSLNIVRTPTAVVRTDLQKRLGGYKPELPHCGDLELWMRLAAHASVGVLGAYQAAYRFHGDNMHRAYHRTNLPDLGQRKATFDCIFESWGNLLENGQELHRGLLAPLAYEAIGYANVAFNKGEMELAHALRTFAVEAHPEIRRTARCLLFSCKQHIGMRTWRAIYPALGWLRGQRSRIGKTFRLIEASLHELRSH